MDKCFKGTESFIAVNVDDILVFSKNEKKHAKHLEKMLKIYEDNGLVLSPTKMKIIVSTIDFLGADVTLKTDCQAIISFYNKTNSNKSSRVRWIKFADAVTRTGVKINIEHIGGKHNTLADYLSRLVNLCFEECTGEMKQLAATTLYSVEEVLQSPNAFQKNMKITCEEVMKISNHFQESSHMKN
ncbi:putative polyprotein [Tanacetum coccineum]